jgi:hypothetical protein
MQQQELVTVEKVDVFAKKLRAQLVRLKAKREKDLAAYKRDVALWRKAFPKWVAANVASRTEKLTAGEIREVPRYGNSRFAGFSAALLQGAPEPPAYPDGKPIAKIQALLRHLGITGQETVRISTSEALALLGDPEENE